ncbi:ABC transporter permease [Citricoccus sp. NPDC055426]|uniref:ABC transporter permease n=1 Tax=Citricoccus sp. NPDC055426 TaxID=3155536 RepID=UPI0034475E0A
MTDIDVVTAGGDRPNHLHQPQQPDQRQRTKQSKRTKQAKQTKKGAEAPGAQRQRRARMPLLTVLCIVWTVLIVGGALLAPLLPMPGYEEPIAGSAQAPFTDGGAAILGTDTIGRSILSRMIYGAQLSLLVAFMGTAIGLVVGALLGMAAAYYKGWSARVITLLSDSVLAFPGLVLLLATATIIPPSVASLSIILGVLTLPASMRIAYSNTNAHLARDYVAAARALGMSGGRIILREILPNILFSLAAFGFIMVGTFMVALAALDFLGVGMPPPRPSWGGDIASGFASIRTRSYLVLVPSVFLVATVFSLNQIGDYLRDKAEGRGGQL